MKINKNRQKCNISIKNYILFIIMLLSIQFLFSGCGVYPEIEPTDDSSYSYSDMNPLPEITTAESLLEAIGCDSFFSAGDKEIGYSESDDVHINLSGEQIFCNSSSVKIEGSQAVITEEGNYIISGNLENGSIKIDTDIDKNVRIVLNGAVIVNDKASPIYVEQANKVLITLVEETENVLENDCTDLNGSVSNDTVFANSCITINGLGSLKAISKAGNGIASDSSVLVTGGNISIEAAKSGLEGKKSVRISNTDMKINSAGKGISSNNNEDSEYGFVYISDGSFIINSGSSGIEAASSLVVDGGYFEITSDDSYCDENVYESKYESGLTEEKNGLNAGVDISVSGGRFIIESSDNGLNAGESVFVTGGSFIINSENKGIESGSAVFVGKSGLIIKKSADGICSERILVNGGNIKIDSSGTGISAKETGADQSEPSENSEDCFVEISGGTVEVNSLGDGIYSCGGILVSDGYLTVVSSENSRSFVFCKESDIKIIGGTVFAAGDFTGEYADLENIKQAFVAVNIDSIDPQSAIVLQGNDGKAVVSQSVNQSITSLFISSPELERGQRYNLVNGNNVFEVKALSF